MDINSIDARLLFAGAAILAFYFGPSIVVVIAVLRRIAFVDNQQTAQTFYGPGIRVIRIES